jgi:hypothetical protein
MTEDKNMKRRNFIKLLFAAPAILLFESLQRPIKSLFKIKSANKSIIEILNQQNEVLKSMEWREGNLPKNTDHTFYTEIPKASWRNFNGRKLDD